MKRECFFCISEKLSESTSCCKSCSGYTNFIELPIFNQASVQIVETGEIRFDHNCSTCMYCIYNHNTYPRPCAECDESSNKWQPK